MIFSNVELILICVIFTWTGFVRTGLGFGGSALGLPLMLLIGATPVYWLPIIGCHLIIFSTISLSKSFRKVDWRYLRKSLIWIIPTAAAGIVGLLSLPPTVMTTVIYLITAVHAINWMLDIKTNAYGPWMDKLLLLLGGYISGTSLTGAPIIVTVYTRHVKKESLISTLFVLWFILVTIKMLAFVAADAYIDWQFALYLVPVAAIGHIIGAKVHSKISANDEIFKKCLGSALLLISAFALFKSLF